MFSNIIFMPNILLNYLNQLFIRNSHHKMFTVYQKKLKNAKLQRKEIRKVIEKNCVGGDYDEQTNEHLNYISNPKNFFHR